MLTIVFGYYLFGSISTSISYLGTVRLIIWSYELFFKELSLIPRVDKGFRLCSLLILAIREQNERNSFVTVWLILVFLSISFCLLHMIIMARCSINLSEQFPRLENKLTANPSPSSRAKHYFSVLLANTCFCLIRY